VEVKSEVNFPLKKYTSTINHFAQQQPKIYGRYLLAHLPKTCTELLCISEHFSQLKNSYLSIKLKGSDIFTRLDELYKCLASLQKKYLPHGGSFH